MARLCSEAYSGSALNVEKQEITQFFGIRSVIFVDNFDYAIDSLKERVIHLLDKVWDNTIIRGMTGSDFSIIWSESVVNEIISFVVLIYDKGFDTPVVNEY